MSSLSLSPDLPTKDLFLKACKKGNLELARVLLANGADVNWKDGNLWSGLHIAAWKGNGDLLDLLLAQPGVEVNLKNVNNNSTPLMTACGWGKENIVRKLLQVDGIDLNVRDGSGRTALLEAAVFGKADCLEILLSVPQVDVAVSDNYGYNVAWLALEWSYVGPRCAELLSEDPRVDWNTRDAAGDTPLLVCLKKKKLDMARILLGNPRVDLDVQDSAGKCPETIAR